MGVFDVHRWSDSVPNTRQGGMYYRLSYTYCIAIPFRVTLWHGQIVDRVVAGNNVVWELFRVAPINLLHIIFIKNTVVFNIQINTTSVFESKVLSFTVVFKSKPFLERVSISLYSSIQHTNQCQKVFLNLEVLLNSQSNGAAKCQGMAIKRLCSSVCG